MESQIFRIVFQDSDLLVIEKLKPFLSQRADSGEREGLNEFISRALKIPLFPVHRLDREVLGLMIYSKTLEGADHLSQQFRDRSVQKIYWARVKGVVRQDSQTLVHYLKKNPKNNRVTVFPRETPGAKRAELVYRVKERGDGMSEVFVLLKTGRPHQIRAQLSKIGHPILGDTRYGGVSDSVDESNIQLRSIYLSVMHPKEGSRMVWKLIEGIDPKFLFAES